MMNFDILKRFRAKPKNRVGLDMGSAAIKMVEISVAGESPKLVSIGLSKPSDASSESLVKSIKSLSEDMKITAKEVNISVSGPSVIVRFVSMPKMRDDELKSAIKFEAEKYIPLAIKDCIVDYQILKSDEKANKQEILLVAVKKDLVLNRISVIEEAGFSAGVVDVDTFAVANSYFRNFPAAEPGRAVALLNIGASHTNMSIVKDGVPSFARDIAIGEKDLSQGAKSVAAALLDEVRLSVSYYENQSGKGIEEICLSGGGAGFAGLEGSFQETFESKPSLWDPLKFLDKTQAAGDAGLINNAKGSFAVAVGLALR